MPLIRTLKFNAATDLLKEVSRKVASGELGSSPAEMLAGATEILNSGAVAVEGALRKFVTEDPSMISMKRRVHQLYQRPEPVLITGPSGVGKEIIAKALTIPGQPFVAENCAAIPENLVESVFFGHIKGAFTGATENKIGLLQQAGEGVIFLDEIGDMPLSIQAKFLRAIQEMEIRPVGSLNTVDLECRFIAATRYNLAQLVEQRKFREDLYARLCTFELHITGLKDRPCDIEAITRSKLPNGKLEEIPPFTDKERSLIHAYNVRGIEILLARWRAYGSYE